MNSTTTQQNNGPYADYMRYYPDKWAAISALRCNTGMPFSEANRTIEQLFGVSHEDECRAADAEHEKIYLAQQAEESQSKASTGLFAALGAIFNRSKKDE